MSAGSLKSKRFALTDCRSLRIKINTPNCVLGLNLVVLFYGSQYKNKCKSTALKRIVYVQTMQRKHFQVVNHQLEFLDVYVTNNLNFLFELTN